ncbi:hypothetical protein [Larkinella rosea]|uniref:Uncharacterized protein n=1 Tax=Larkinella rosea TaxID=2025312 RepID=A0A3P1BTV1_9BACT|nr:hypothetical protein [Larkinella rosea]RRB04531.1 hypothetical protein EHT25_13635 [Larkinella rosea]
MLTSYQLSRLRYDLRTLAHIEYEEVENELLDHYATLTEQKMAEGHDVEHASSYAWAELGAGPGLNAIQRDFEKNIKKQVSARHLEILKSYFRWPTIVTTVLIGVLIYIVTPFISARTTLIGTYFVVLIPLGILGFSYLKSRELSSSSRKITWAHLNARAVFIVNIFQMLLGLPFQGDSSARVHFFQTNLTVVGMLECVIVVYLLSFIQLYRENFRYKTA